MSQQPIRIDAVCPRWADDDRPTRPEQITIRATKQGSPFSWRGLAIAVVALMLLVCGGCSERGEPSYPGPYPSPCRYEDMVIQSQSCRWCNEGPVYQLLAGNHWCENCGCFQEVKVRVH